MADGKKSIFKNPVFWVTAVVIIAGIIYLIIYLKNKKAAANAAAPAAAAAASVANTAAIVAAANANAALPVNTFPVLAFGSPTTIPPAAPSIPPAPPIGPSSNNTIVSQPPLVNPAVQAAVIASQPNAQAAPPVLSVGTPTSNITQGIPATNTNTFNPGPIVPPPNVGPLVSSNVAGGTVAVAAQGKQVLNTAGLPMVIGSNSLLG